MDESTRLRKASSRSCFLFEAQMSMVLSLSVSKPSSLRSSTLSIRLEASCCFMSSRDDARASISSTKMMHPPDEASVLAMSKTVARFFSEAPYHLDTTLSSGKYSSGICTWWAMMRADDVLPVPGGPSNSTTLGRFDSPFFPRVPSVIWAKRSGCVRLNNTHSSIRCLTSSYPPRSCHDICSFSSSGRCTSTPMPSSFSFTFHLLSACCCWPGPLGGGGRASGRRFG
mmetsp:Transcript_5491/g.12948  ORF Transcript_5491/g.12948 Transcript_5491/m.12948 type:complete len:227 (-) Transcript_5491:673-1353(-)